MILITGGAYQGKLEYAVNEFAIKEDEVFVCAGPEIDLGAKVLTHFEKYVLACIKTDVDACFNQFIESFFSSIFLN